MANMQIVPAGTWKNCKNVEAQYVEMMVPLYSYGCEKKVKKTLSQLKGIYSVNVDHHQQKVTVWGICNKHDVLATIKSKRKEACFWNPDDNIPMPPVGAEKEEGEGEGEGESRSSPQYNRRDHSNFKRQLSSLAIMKSRSLSWKLTLKKVFTRSFSFN